MKSVAFATSMFCLAASTMAFAPAMPSSTTASAASRTTSLFAKGFGEGPVKKVKSEGAVKREQEASKYDEISGAGGQEYSCFVRQFGSDDQSWLPCGSIAVPRGAQVSDAIYANEDALKKAITRTYPKLAGFEGEFEFGFNLKIYPDDAIEVASKTTKSQGISVGNWISNVLSPIDASKVPPPPIKD